MRSEELFKEFRYLLANDELDEVIEKLQVYVKESKLLDQIILSSARYSDVMKQIRSNTIHFEDAGVEKNKIRNALIEIIGLFEKAVKRDNTFLKETEKIDLNMDEVMTINQSKNINTGNVNTGGGDFRIGD
jgi:hypothetical protein